MKLFYYLLLGSIASCNYLQAQNQSSLKTRPVYVSTSYGKIEGRLDSTGIRIFKGIPYAAPPVGKLRWQPPQPLKKWKGTRPALEFGARAMQLPIYGDMGFRSKEMSEDCLYLNIWAPAGNRENAGKLPVMVYIHGGGFMAGDGSEPRYDGASMARKGIITVTFNYRLGIFGFFAHTELTKESPHHASGNYGLLDQQAALQWVQNNIAAFGGDPKKVTLAGQSAGAVSVSSHMASPLSKGLFCRAIGESGSILGTRTPPTLSVGEQRGMQLMNQLGVSTVEDLRRMPATELLRKVNETKDAPRFSEIVDGYFLPAAPLLVYTFGQQADVPLLAGWNSAEVGSILGSKAPTPEGFTEAVHKLYGNNASSVLAMYAHGNEKETAVSAVDLATDRFAAFNTWKWIDLHGKTNGYPVYRYLFAKTSPASRQQGTQASTSYWTGALHSAEIEYAFGNLSLNTSFEWTADDYKISAMMQQYFANFIITGNPNGKDLPNWPGLQSSIPKIMIFDVDTKADNERNAKRYQFFDSLIQPK